ncbi:MAG: hypothetical protein WCZ66_03615 [Sphingomonadaceae bacterium]
MNLLIAAAASIVLPGLPLEELPQQKLESGRCVAFLWTRTTPPLRVAMIDEATSSLRIRKDSKQRDLPHSQPGYYRASDISIRVDLDFAPGSTIPNGEIIRQGAIRIEQPGKDTLVMPVGGVRACQ